VRGGGKVAQGPRIKKKGFKKKPGNSPEETGRGGIPRGHCSERDAVKRELARRRVNEDTLGGPAVRAVGGGAAKN